MKEKRPSVTLKAIAEYLRISPATVSLAIRNKECVAEETRRNVWEAVRKLGYVYNRSAARLRTQRSSTIGLIVPNILNPFFTELTSVVEEHLDGLGYSLLLAKTSEDRVKQERALRTMLEYSVEGVLLCPATGSTQEDLRIFEQSRTPLVLFTRPIDGQKVDYVGPDNTRGTFNATRYLIEKGHRRIAFVGGETGSFTRWERFEGYRLAMRQEGLPISKEHDRACNCMVNGGYHAIQELLTVANPPTAAVCFNDVTAFGVILGLWAAHVVPGKDFDVVGFDNISDASLWSPPLTTLSCPPTDIGKKALDLLLERVKNPSKPVDSIFIAPELILRRSG